MALSDVIGQDRALGMLKGAFRRGRMASSYLFAGEDAIGKKFAAMNFAMALNCKSPVVDPDGFGDACGECPSCRHALSGTHPDMLLVEPLTSEILVCQIRASGGDDRCDREKYEKPRVEDMLAFRSHEGGYKTVIIDRAECMNQSAANAFLKTLEEPPERSIIILVSSMPDMLLPTIRSRCSRLNFRPLRGAEVAAIVGQEAESPLVRLAMGRPGAALSEEAGAMRERFFEQLKSVLSAGSKAEWSDRQEIESWLDMAMLLLRDMATSAITGSGRGLVNADMAEELAGMSRGASAGKILEAYGKIRQLRARQQFNLNKGITWNYAGCILGNVING